MATPPRGVRACAACLSRGFRVSAQNPSRNRKRKQREARDEALLKAAEAGNPGAIAHLQKRRLEEAAAAAADAATSETLATPHATAHHDQQQQQQQQGSSAVALASQIRSWLAQPLTPCRQCNGLGVTVGHAAEVPDDFVPENGPRVVIVGAGIGGCALALALQQRKIPCTVYERDPGFSSRAQGYALTMQQASNTLRRLGFRDLVNLGAMPVSHASLLPNGTIVNEYGRKCHSTTRKTMSNGKPPDKQRFNIQLPREAVRQMLHDALAPGTIRWGANFNAYRPVAEGGGDDTSMASSGSALRVTFDDVKGTAENGNETSRFEVDADLVVGCDGIWSRVRRQKLGEEAPRYLGLIVILGRAPCSHLLTDDKMFQTLGGETRIYTMPFTRGVTMWQLSFPMPLEEAKALSAAGPVALLEEAQRRCSGWHDPVPDLLSATRSCDVTGYPAYDRAPADVDETSARLRAPTDDVDARVTLLGDALHPMSPFKGQGANQALMDAWSLASLIASTKPLEHALRVFETEMVDRVREKVEKSAEAAEILHSSKAIEERASRLVT
ncbi:Zeaxanthin epoxidase, chloroplastic [Hondaea fermentalgiana]|uniref:Zeaxanthin epoxidase, chloroplastic n=1 Tax=Hondaea fermentalgiana TaxID=2315210 RepID=A0A2R5GFN4_9STRA|nr:Zeaxanthin epoxidase, chloroplastic [Hondaea fermentalgiana]|eukprot:GBG26664.1 Zeaxanthin epoxidase, chloroplastic [Hondaea fermentalgiana]